MSRTLHLIKHGQPQIIPGVPAHEWELAKDALDGLPGLIAQLNPAPQIIISSEEPKSRATARALAAALNVPQRPMLGLHEHLRYSTPHLPAAEFQAAVKRFFAEPDRVAMGEESANDARTRFGNAINAVMLGNVQDTLAVVAHGTVISLLAAASGKDPAQLWQALTFLDVVTLSWPGLTLREPLA